MAPLNPRARRSIGKAKAMEGITRRNVSAQLRHPARNRAPESRGACWDTLARIVETEGGGREGLCCSGCVRCAGAPHPIAPGTRHELLAPGREKPASSLPFHLPVFNEAGYRLAPAWPLVVSAFPNRHWGMRPLPFESSGLTGNPDVDQLLRSGGNRSEMQDQAVKPGLRGTVVPARGVN